MVAIVCARDLGQKAGNHLDYLGDWHLADFVLRRRCGEAVLGGSTEDIVLIIDKALNVLQALDLDAIW